MEQADQAVEIDEDDARVLAALEVLTGSDAADVAARAGVEEALVLRWSRQFLDGGTAALRNQGTVDPAARDRFLALVSHELRTPLTVISGWLETLRAMPVDDQDQHLVEAGLTAMASHTDRLIRLAEDLLDSAAVSLGRLRLDEGRVEMTGLAEEVVASFEGRRISAAIEPGLVVDGDRDRLGQMLTNIISDGLARTTGPLTLRIGRADKGAWVDIHLIVPGDPPPFEEMHALFEPFNGGTGNAHTGLGLYVTRALAVAHGGQCGVEADDDSLTLWIRLPVRGPEGSRRG